MGTKVGACTVAPRLPARPQRAGAALADTAAWEPLTELARELGQDTLATRFAAAGVREAQQVERVRTWLSAGLRAEVHVGAPQDTSQPPSP